ncbi:MAG: sulfite exporter TauE/SafE family protein [Verrucomicrobiia bacterium]|jgi:uncharacterized membrane protein YfcA
MINYIIPALIGLFGGIASGLFGVGGGVVMVPAMIYFLSLTPHQAVGTSLFVIIPTVLMSAGKHFSMDNVVWRVGLLLMPTAIIGGYLGAYLTKFLSGPDLKRAFGGFLILVGLRLLFLK